MVCTLSARQGPACRLLLAGVGVVMLNQSGHALSDSVSNLLHSKPHDHVCLLQKRHVSL